jgi:hypothetical protein
VRPKRAYRSTRFGVLAIRRSRGLRQRYKCRSCATRRYRACRCALDDWVALSEGYDCDPCPHLSRFATRSAATIACALARKLKGLGNGEFLSVHKAVGSCMSSGKSKKGGDRMPPPSSSRRRSQLFGGNPRRLRQRPCFAVAQRHAQLGLDEGLRRGTRLAGTQTPSHSVFLLLQSIASSAARFSCQPSPVRRSPRARRTIGGGPEHYPLNDRAGGSGVSPVEGTISLTLKFTTRRPAVLPVIAGSAIQSAERKTLRQTEM